MVPRKEETVSADFNTDSSKFETNRASEKLEHPIVSEQNGSIRLELGTYKALKIPAILIAINLSFFPLYMTLTVDPRMEGLPLLGSTIPLWIICLSYMFFSLVWGPRYMANRPPIKLRKVKMVYNLVQVAVCSYVFVQAGRLGWFWDYNWQCQPIDMNPDPEGTPFQITRVVYVYYLTKILDLMDTVFFVLNKKWAHITLLHVFHHGALVAGIYIGAKHQPGGHGTFMGLLNSFVHVLMYGYYFLALLGPSVRPYLWWKKYLTMLQMIQFVIVFFHALQVFFIDCPINKLYQLWSCAYAIIFLYLFRDFYLYSYKKAPLINGKIATEETSTKNSNGIQDLKQKGAEATSSKRIPGLKTE